jgi:hypothetical protein
MPEPKVDWRFALITSSIAGISWRVEPRSVRARIAGKAGIGRQWVSSEHRKNGREFPVPRASRQRFVALIAFSSEAGTGSRRKTRRNFCRTVAMAADGSIAAKQKGRREAGLS